MPTIYNLQLKSNACVDWIIHSMRKSVHRYKNTPMTVKSKHFKRCYNSQKL